MLVGKAPSTLLKILLNTAIKVIFPHLVFACSGTCWICERLRLIVCIFFFLDFSLQCWLLRQLWKENPAVFLPHTLAG